LPSGKGRGGIAHGCDDAVIGSASTEVSGHVFSDFDIRSCMPFTDTGDCRHDLARRAIAALEGVVFEKGFLHRMQGAVVTGNAFDRGYLTVLDLGRQGETGEHSLAIDMTGTGTALALIAAFFGTGQIEMFAQGIEKRHAGLDIEPMRLSVDVEIEVDRLRHENLLLPEREKKPLRLDE
jgi:hypothetical protein